MISNDVLLRVRPVAGGWVVEGGDRLEALRFSSSGRAEAQAHALAEAVARAGGDARVAVHDLADRLIGSRRYFADAP
jgi:hypothetical protein